MSKLAIKGGVAVRSNAFASWPQYGEKELGALNRVLESGIWGIGGSEVRKFQKRFTEYQHAGYGICVTSGTTTLEIILRAMGIGSGDEVITTPYTFFATVSSILCLGAKPVFADIEKDTYNIDPDSIEKAITPATKAIIPVHIGGRACDMDRIMSIAEKHHLYVIEDCAHAHGSEWKGQRVGSIGDAGSFSFQSSKNLCSGEGGFITAKDVSIYEKCWSVHNCGRDLHDKTWYAHHNTGTNARMTEWQAAILDAQMDKLDEEIKRREENAAYLNSRLKEIACIEILKADSRVTRNSHHIFIFKFKSEKCKGLTREKFIEALSAEGIPCSPGYVCLYKQPALSKDYVKKIAGNDTPYGELYLENAEAACYKEGVWLMQNILLGDRRDMDEIADAIIKIQENVDELL